jgi:hypothetical protein
MKKETGPISVLGLLILEVALALGCGIIKG